MKKRRFKYQQGGAPRVFNVQLPNGSVEPFSPLIQMAAQPIETGLQTIQMIEALKSRKLQEDRFKQQMAFDELRFAADQKRFAAEEEQRKLNNEFLSLNKTAAIVDPDINIPVLPTDQPTLEDLKTNHGVNSAYGEFRKNPSNENREILIDKVSKMMLDPTYQTIRRRFNEDAIYQSRLKGDLKGKEGYYTTDYEDFLAGKTNKITYNIDNEGYDANKKEIDALERSEKAQNIEKRKMEVKKGNVAIASENKKLEHLKQLEARIEPLVKEWDTATPERRIQIKKEINDLTEMMNFKADPLGRSTSATDPLKAFEDQIKVSRLAEINKIAIERGIPLHEAEQIYNIETAATKKNYESRIPELNKSLDEIYSAGDYGTFLDNLGKGFKPNEKTIGDFTSRINAHTWNNKDKKPEGYKVSYWGLYNNDPGKKWVDLSASPDTKFIPDFDNSVSRSDGKTEMGGYLYKRIKNEEWDDHEKEGWIQDDAPIESKYKVKMAKGNSDYKIVKIPAYINLGQVKAGTPPVNSTSDNGSSIPSIPNYSQNYLKERGVIVDSNENEDFTYSLKNNLIPNQTLKAIGELPSVLGDNIIPTGHWHHLRLPERDSLDRTKKIKNNNPNGRYAPNNFDISLRNFASDIWSPKDHQAIYQSLVNNKEFLDYLKRNNYAVVLEGFDPNSKYPSLDELRKVPIIKSKLEGDAPHLSFEYLGETKQTYRDPTQQ